MADLDPIEFELKWNSQEFMTEFQKFLKGGKDADGALEKVKEKFAEITVEQANASKEGKNLVSVISEVEKAVDKVHVDHLVDKENISIQIEVIQELEQQVHAVNAELAKPLPAGQKEKLIEESKKLTSELNLEKSALDALQATAIKPVKFSPEGLTKENLQVQKQVIKELEQELKELQKTIDKKAPSQNKLQLMGDANKLKKELADEKQALQELEIEYQKLNSSQSSLQAQYRQTINAMREMELQGKKDSGTYQDLVKKATEYKSAMAQVAKEQQLLVSGNKLQGYVTGLSIMTGGLAAAQGATSLLAGENENLQKIMLKVQSLTAITIGLQQIQQSLTSTSAFQIQVLTKVKELWAVANLKVATTLGISTVAAQVLMATITLGLSVAITGIIIAFSYFAEKQKESAALNKKVAESAAEPIMQYKKLREEWNNLANDLKAKEKFITDNASEFAKLGISVTNTTEAENVFVKNTSAMETALMQRAKAAAAMQLATENYKKALEAEQEAESDQETLKNGSAWERGMIGLKVNSRFTVIGKQIDEAQGKADSFFKKSLDYEKQAEKALSKAGIGTDTKKGKDSKFEYSAEIKTAEKKLEIEKARYGKADEMERDLYNKKIAYATKDKDEYAKISHEKELFEAGILKKLDDEAQKASERKINRAKMEAQRLIELAKKVREEITSAEDNVANKQTEGNEIASIKKRYDQLRARAKKAGLDKIDIVRINVVEKTELDSKQYELDTKELLKNLNEEKDLFAAYEALKTKIGETEAKNRYNISLEEFGNFGDVLDAEIEKLTNKSQKSYEENERLKALMEKKGDFDKNKNKAEVEKYAEAFQDAITHQEKLESVTKIYDDRALELQKITNEKLRAEKLEQNKKNREIAIQGINTEAAVKLSQYEQLETQLLNITTRQLRNRISTLKEFLATEIALTKEQKEKLLEELATGENLLKVAETDRNEKVLLDQKAQILKDINKLKGDGNKLTVVETELIAKLLVKLGFVNAALRDTKIEKMQKIADWSATLLNSFSDLANSIDDSNKGLVDMLAVMAELATDVGNILGAFSKGLVEGIVSLVATAIKWVGKLFTMGKRARESERKAQEEMKKRQDEILQSQLDYNATLRARMVDETKLNDLYKSRVDNIKEEMAARKKAMAENLKDQQNIFNKLLGYDIVTSQTTKKHGGFLGMGKKTKVVDHYESLRNLLGIDGDDIQITDELFDRLERLNAQHPFSGDAKVAYDQLKKLRDEYGSFEEANRQLEIQLKNAITGTTAQTLADSIREGLKSGKKSFADFADDIEGFLREAIMAGISAKMIEPKIQELQDALAEMMGDGILSAEERAQFQAMYMAIVNQSSEYMDLINQAGVNMTGGSNANSLSGALKGASQQSIDLLAGHTMGMRLTQLETNQILKSGSAQMLEKTSQMIAIQIDIERNTRKTAENTEKLYDVNDNVVKVVDGQDKYYKALVAAGIIK